MRNAVFALRRCALARRGKRFPLTPNPSPARGEGESRGVMEGLLPQASGLFRSLTIRI